MFNSDRQQRCTNIENRWFTTECYEKRQTFYKRLNIYRQDKNENNRMYMCNFNLTLCTSK